MPQNYLIGAFGPPCTVSIDFADAETRKQASVKKENGQTVLVPLFLGQESVVGEASLTSFSISCSLRVKWPPAQAYYSLACFYRFLTNSLISFHYLGRDVCFCLNINLFWLFQL